VARDPSDHEKYFNLARACEKLEQWDEMADALRAATRLAPEFANYWWKLGQASMHEGHLRTA
jgi:cytochrome c-type biogenesis protein CcmH/NrfG